MPPRSQISRVIRCSPPLSGKSYINGGAALLDRLMEIAGIDPEAVARRVATDASLGFRVAANYLAGLSKQDLDRLVMTPEMQQTMRSIQKSVAARIRSSMAPQLADFNATLECVSADLVRVGGLNNDDLVGAGGFKPNTWQRFERLGSAWEPARLSVAEDGRSAVESEPGVVANPGRRARTPLTESEVDAIRTARENGVSVTTLAWQYGVHRGTVWEKTGTVWEKTR